MLFGNRRTTSLLASADGFHRDGSEEGMAATRELHSAEALGVSWTTNEIERNRPYIRSHCYLTDEAFDVDWTTKKIEAKPHQIG
jgi:hypothetical protein